MITYGVLLGIGSGLSYPIPLTLALKWHPHKKGLVSGLIFVARGLSVFVFTPLQTYYVNPYNISPVKMSVYADIQDVPTGTPKMEKYFVDERVLNRVPMLFVCMGSLCMIIQCVSASLMPNPSHVNHVSAVRYTLTRVCSCVYVMCVCMLCVCVCCVCVYV